jgi:uncharacterized membrane protein
MRGGNTMAAKKVTDTKRLALLSILTALTAVLSYMGGFIKVGGLASISLTLIPVVIGGALCGKSAGVWIGGVSGVIFFLTPDSAFWLGLSAAGTVITVMLKAIAAGWCAGLVYELLEKKNRYTAVFTAAIVCPVINTGIFLVGCLVFFLDTVKELAGAQGMTVGAFLIIGFVGLNFVFELLVNIILSPVILRLINIKKKNV